MATETCPLEGPVGDLTAVAMSRLDELITAIQRSGASKNARQCLAWQAARDLTAAHHYTAEAVADDAEMSAGASHDMTKPQIAESVKT